MKKNKSPILRIAAQYFLIFIIFTAIFFLFIHSPFFRNEPILFFRGILLLILTTMVMVTVVLPLRARWNISYETILAALVISVFLHLTLFVLFPVTFDRSITMFILNTLSRAKNECQGYSSRDLEQKLIRVYVRQNNALEKRLQEQERLDFVWVENQCIQLTTRGKAFVDLSVLLKKLYGVE